MRTYSDGPLVGVGFPTYSRPSIQPNHIDGPLLVLRDGQLHWLTLWERIQFALGWTDAEKIEQYRRPNLMNALLVQLDMERRRSYPQQQTVMSGELVGGQVMSDRGAIKPR